MNTESLKSWAKEKDVIKRTYEAFEQSFKNYIEEENEEFCKYFGDLKRELLKVYFKNISLKIVDLKHIDLVNDDREFVEVYLGIRYDEMEIGYYSLLFDLSGDEFDDFLIFDYKCWYIHQKIDVLYELRDELVEEMSLNEESKMTMFNMLNSKINKIQKEINR